MEGLEALGENTKFRFITLHRSQLHTRTELYTTVLKQKIGLQTWALSSGFARLRQPVMGLLVDHARTHISLNCLMTPAQHNELSSHFPSSLRFSPLSLQMNNTDRLPVALIPQVIHTESILRDSNQSLEIYEILVSSWDTPESQSVKQVRERLNCLRRDYSKLDHVKNYSKCFR